MFWIFEEYHPVPSQLILYRMSPVGDSQNRLSPFLPPSDLYALIAETLFQKPVVGLGLIYFEPVTDIVTAGGLIDAAGMSMGFKAKLLSIERDAELVSSLLAQAKEIHDLPAAPAGRDGCRDCGLLGTKYDTMWAESRA